MTTRVRTIKYSAYRRNLVFWIERQMRGEEIRLVCLQRSVGVLFAQPRLPCRT